MQTVVSKTFDEIQPGDTACVQRTLQAGDVRAWAAAFGDAGALAEAADGQGAAGVVTAILTGLAASALPGPGAAVRAAAVQGQRALPIATVPQVRGCRSRCCSRRKPSCTKSRRPQSSTFRAVASSPRTEPRIRR